MVEIPESAKPLGNRVRLHRVGNEDADLAQFCRSVLPSGSFKTILIKPNWVKHQEDPCFPIEALVTSTNLIEAVIEACLRKYPDAQEITIGDVPLQSCDWELLMRQAGVDRLIEKYSGVVRPQIRFVDLRREIYREGKRYRSDGGSGSSGDPRGYREVRLDGTSFLDPISEASEKFRVADYSPRETVSSHKRGFHRYLIAATALSCDLLINLPKMKVHQKAGVTGALKNLVGVNGQKAYLVHYRAGLARQHGDEFPDDISKLVRLQSWLRQCLHDRSRTLFHLLRLGWLPLKRLAGIQTRGTPENLGKSFYLAGGAWHGNDTIWRMVYDLNRIIRYADGSGNLTSAPQRAYVAIMDAMVAGEGNGPLQPLPVDLQLVLAADDPFKMDIVMARLMGFDYRKIVTLRQHRCFADPEWGNFTPEELMVESDGDRVESLDRLPVLRRFLAPPGWKSHIELEEMDAEGTFQAESVL
jgi:uncharacterized protein (DUF362 family)